MGEIPQLGLRHHSSSFSKQDHPPPPTNHGKENLPPPEGPRKLPRKMRPRRRQGKHQFHRSSQTGSHPGTSQSPSSAMSTPVKHPRTFQRPQHPQPPGPVVNHNSGCAHLQDHPESARLYKPASSSIQQDSTTRSRRANFSESNLPSSALQQSHRGYFSGSPSGPSNKPVLLTDPYREARIAGGPRSGPAHTHSVLPFLTSIWR